MSLSRSDAWAVGESPDRKTHALVEHWDGQRWRWIQIPAKTVGFGVDLDAVAANSLGIWITGLTGSQSLVLHWSRGRWRLVGLTQAFLAAVVAPAPNDVWTVGDQGIQYLAMHWNGAQWRTFAIPTVKGGQLQSLTSVAALGPDNVWAVGSELDQTGDTLVVMHWNGKHWKNERAPSGGDLIRSISVQPSITLWVAGGNLADRSFIWRSNGHRWMTTFTRAHSEISAVDADRNGGVWAVGRSGSSFPNPLVERYGC